MSICSTGSNRASKGVQLVWSCEVAKACWPNAHSRPQPNHAPTGQIVLQQYFQQNYFEVSYEYSSTFITAVQE